MKNFSFKAKLWKYPGMAGWHFVYVPEKESKVLKALPKAKKRGFNSIKIKARIGKSTWKTSLFPSKEGPYLLAVKASVRQKEDVEDGDTARVECIIL